MSKKLNILFLSTYPPLECGIATYTKNLIDSIDKSKVNIYVAAINDAKYKYDSIVKYEIDQQNKSDYIKLAQKINASNIDVVCVQHEFGIFGGYDGKMLIDFLKNLKKPAVMTMHTVPIYQEKPFKIIPKHYKNRTKLLEEIIKYIDAITVMTETAKKYLYNNFDFAKKSIYVIPHGAPYISDIQIKKYKKEKNKIGFKHDDFIITSFGLISPRKGLEYIIQALPEIIKKNPQKNIKYLIAGRVHPSKPKKYLLNLKKIINKLKIEDCIVFDTRYLTYEEIYKYLSNTDIYVTPYYRKEQASSGTLSYALSIGCPIASSPYIFARDIVNEFNVGELFNFQDHHSVEKTFNHMIGNSKNLKKYSTNSRSYGKNVSWSKIGQKFLDTFQSIKTP